MKIVCTVGQALSRVPVDVVVCQLMMYSNVIVGITISRRSFVFSQSRVKVSKVAHKPTTTLRQLLTNVKDRDEPNNRQGAVYKIKCSDCQASYIGETGRNLNTRLTEHKRATRNGDANNHIAVHLLNA